MVTINKSCEILASVDRVWELLSDTDKDEEHWGAIRDIKVISKVGNTIEREATVGPRAFAHKSRQTILLDPKKSIGLTMVGEAMSGGRRSLGPFGQEQHPDRRLGKLEVKDVPGFVQNIVKGQISKATEEALKKFKKEAERAAPAAGMRGAT